MFFRIPSFIILFLSQFIWHSFKIFGDLWVRRVLSLYMFDFLLPVLISFLVGSNTVLSILFSDNLNLFARIIELTNKFKNIYCNLWNWYSFYVFIMKTTECASHMPTFFRFSENFKHVILIELETNYTLILLFLLVADLTFSLNCHHSFSISWTYSRTFRFVTYIKTPVYMGYSDFKEHMHETREPLLKSAVMEDLNSIYCRFSKSAVRWG